MILPTRVRGRAAETSSTCASSDERPFVRIARRGALHPKGPEVRRKEDCRRPEKENLLLKRWFCASTGCNVHARKRKGQKRSTRALHIHTRHEVEKKIRVRSRISLSN
jgi:hypothetical protein